MGNCSYFLPTLHGPLGLHRQQSILTTPRSGFAVQEWKVTRDFARSKAIHSRRGVILLTGMSGAVAFMASTQGGTQCFVFGRVKLSSPEMPNFDPSRSGRAGPYACVVLSG